LIVVIFGFVSTSQVIGQEIVFKMTYAVSCGMLNPTIQHHLCWRRKHCKL